MFYKRKDYYRRRYVWIFINLIDHTKQRRFITNGPEGHAYYLLRKKVAKEDYKNWIDITRFPVSALKKIVKI